MHGNRSRLVAWLTAALAVAAVAVVPASAAQDSRYTVKALTSNVLCR